MDMTYPPQQPGPYGPQQNPYGQQPGWPQQQQQPGYGAPQYGMPPGYGHPGGMPPKKKTGLIVALAIAGVLLVGGGVTAVVLLTGDDKGSSGETGATGSTTKNGEAGSAEAVVQQVIKAIDDKDSQAAVATLCDPKTKSPAFELDEAPASVTLKASMSGGITEAQNSARAKLSIKVSESGTAKTTSVSMTLNLSEQQPGRWCVATATMGSSSSSGTARPSSTRPTF
jgi:hypothetical protein